MSSENHADLAQRLQTVRERIRAAERAHGREPGSVELLAVSKTYPAAILQAAVDAGQQSFGENYLQEALSKIADLKLAKPSTCLHWHYIGAIQSRKAADISEHFSWVHTLDRLKVARKLNAARPADSPPLQVLLQVNIDDEPQKAGLPADLAKLKAFATELAEYPKLRLRGLMCLPAQREGFSAQREPFARLRVLQAGLNDAGYRLDQLSMGMSGDLEAAIAEGASIVRVGTAFFGAR